MNQEFLKKIKQKLQVGNSRSIHLNLYPGRYAARLDLMELDKIKFGLAKQFVDKLLNNTSFSFKFKAEAENNTINTASADLTKPSNPKEQKSRKDLAVKRLASIYYENEDTFLEHGVKTFAFGFPLMMYRSQNDPEKIINAPVLIWKLDLHRDKNEWIIQRDEESGITINDVLLNYLEQDLGSAGFFSLNDEMLSDALIDKNEVLQIVNKLVKQISSNAADVKDLSSFMHIPDKFNREGLVNSGGSPIISFSGAFGLFKTQKEAVINDVIKLISEADTLKFDKLETGGYQQVLHTAIETDPTQKHALNSITDNNKLVIHGPPGTGKSQTLTAIIVNALFNKAKCLVVCEKRTALEVIQKNLTMLGLGSLCGLIEDVNRDRKKIVDAVRDPKPITQPVSENILQSIFVNADSTIDEVNRNHKFYGKYILNNNTWSDLAGRFLEKQQGNINYENLYKSIKDAGIDFRSEKLSEDYNKRSASVSRNHKLYQPAKDVIDKFKILNDDLFDDRSVKEIVLELSKELNEFITDISNILSNAEKVHSDYHNALKLYYADYYRKFSEFLTALYNTFEKNTAINASLFNKIGGFSDVMLNFRCIFSKKYKTLRADKRQFIETYPQIKNYASKNYFECNFTEISDDLSLDAQQILSAKQKLDAWHAGIEVYISNELNTYHNKSYNSHAWDKIELLNNVNNNFHQIISVLNSSKILSESLIQESDSILYSITFLTSIKDKLALAVSDIDSLYDYSYWRQDFLQNDEPGKKLINELIKIESPAWENDFEMWYLFNLLITNERSITLRDDSLYGSLHENFEQIRQYQLDIIKNYWKQKQAESETAFEARSGININALYNKSRNSKFQKKNSLRKIIAADFNVFTDHFPVMLVNPTVCSSLFEMKEGMFDIVIFDEASQLRVEDVYAAKLRGKNRVVAGDENQMPPSSYFASSALFIDSDGTLSEDEAENIAQFSEGLAESESLLEFAIRRGYKEAYLDIHYRSRHPDLIGFSNAAFYNSRLNPVPPARNYKAIRYIQTYGIYDPSEGINLVEAQKVLMLIDDLIKIEKGNENPSIGIATLNVLQRNFILDLIQRRLETDNVFAEKINILRNKAGETFFVKNLENIQGDERDIIIISTTFGKKPDSSFLQNFGPINQEKGFRLLNVIVTRAKHMMIVCTSIPEENISEYSSLLPVSGNKGKAVFYAYLAYARAIEKNDLSEKQSIIDLLESNREKSETTTEQQKETAFELEVIKKLGGKISQDRIVHKYQVGGFTIDIAIVPEDQNSKVIAIECDGSNYHNSAQAYLWDIFRQSYLEKFGIKFIRTWSVNWWNNPERELNKLLDAINKASENN